MEIIKLDEQEIVNAICVFIAYKKRTIPDNVMVELVFEDESGFSAEIEVNGVLQYMKESEIIEALRKWMNEEYQMDPYAIGIQLDIHDGEGIVAYIS